ncbi:MAG: hypothetical protein IJU68_05610 [Bacteroidales bacterium]|nr:hypothetical protein [Bacteroidales bacterium]
MTVTANKEPIVHFRDASAGGIITLKGDLDLLPIDFKKNINVDIYYGTDEFELKNKATAVLEDTEESFGALTISFTARLNGLDDGEVYYFGIKANYGKESPVEVASVKFFTLPDGAVDLDLPSGNLWLSNNLGATYPEESGDYYAWAETEPKKTNGLYNWSSYKWCDGSYDKLTKYCLSQWVGIVDNKNTIEREDDAATKKMGGSWHIASELEWSELLTKCQRESIKYNGVPGVLFRSKNNPNDNKKVIFIPASGYYSGGQISDEYRCCYWSSTCCESYSSYDAYYFTSEYSFYSKMSYSSRCLGLSIRPCRAKI